MGINKRAPGWGSYLWTTLLVALGAAVFVVAMEAFYFTPWAYSLLGQPTLVGTWVGDFRTPSGVSGVFYLEIRHWTGNQIGQTPDHPAGAKLHGEERWCFRDGRRETYPLTGAANRVGDQIWVEHDEPATSAVGIDFEDLRGDWIGDRLHLSGTPAVFDGKTYLGWAQSKDVRSQTDFLLHPGTLADFETLCANMK